MKELPENFVIKSKPNDPLWKEYINWCNENYFIKGGGWDGDLHNTFYGCVEGKPYCMEYFPKGVIVLEIALEEWDEIINGVKLCVPIGTKFTCPKSWDTKTIFTIQKQVSPKNVVVVWCEKYGSESVTYSNEQVNESFRDGIWVKYESEKPFSDLEEVTYEMITKHGFFKNLTIDELKEIIDYMNFKCYRTLEGDDAWEKAEVLFNKFNNSKFPGKWCIKSSEEEVLEYVNKHGEIPPYSKNELATCYAHFPPFEGCTTSGRIMKGYTEINFKEFKKHILKQEPMEKKIIGYKLKNKEYEKVANFIATGKADWNNLNFQIKSPAYYKIKEAGILDKWFEPIYENTPPNLIIKGSEVRFTENAIKFAGRTYTKDYIFALEDMLNYGFDLNTEKYKIREIADYFRNKSK